MRLTARQIDALLDSKRVTDEMADSKILWAHDSRTWVSLRRRRLVDIVYLITEAGRVALREHDEREAKIEVPF